MSVGIIFKRDQGEGEIRVSYADEARISHEIAGLVLDTSLGAWTVIGERREDGAALLRLYTAGALRSLALIKRPGAPIRARFSLSKEDLLELLEPAQPAE